MPKTKGQKAVFSLLMALVMVYGMEVYNHIVAGDRSASSFTIPVLELAGLMLAVIALEELIAGRIARRIAFAIVDAEKARPLAVIVAIQVATVCLMCPMMSFVATLVFKASMPGPLPLKWIRTVAVNLPMAMAWQLLVAGPLVRGVVKRVRW
jgi:hypothetical protein